MARSTRSNKSISPRTSRLEDSSPVQPLPEIVVGDSASDSDEEQEDYDSILIDPDALIEGAQGGMSDLQRRASHNDVSAPALRAATSLNRRSSEPGDDRSSGLENVLRRRNVQVKLEKMSAEGRYTLTADDPDIRDILKRVLERESSASSQRTRLRDLVFTRQFTTFDRQNPLSADSPFFGFFTLFWLAMLLMFVKVAANNYRHFGSILGSNEMMRIMFSRDVLVLGLTDLAMLLSTTFGFFLHRIIARGLITWSGAGIIIQNLWQAAFLFTIIWWTYYRDWPWTHTSFMILHALVYLMKQHSYAFYNGHLSSVARRRIMLQSRIEHLHEKDPVRTMRSRSPARQSVMDSIAEGLHHPALGVRTSTNLTKEKSDVANVAAAIESGQPLDSQQMDAFERVIREELDALDHELQGKCSSPANAYPNNLNWKNFIEWTCFPTLVYELEYPRQESINWWYVAEKTAATFGVIGVMMVISQAYIYPAFAQAVRMKEAGMTLQERWAELPWLVGDMLFPMLLEQLLTWYVIWECILNVLAEITRFASRNFYGLWWNSSGFDYYARNWNRPVHHFLLRHVYHSSISTFHLKKSTATFVTFLLSALVHELIMACLFKKVRGYLFTMQLLQIPMVSVMNTRYMKGREVLGNVVFWFGLFIGPAALTSLYLLI